MHCRRVLPLLAIIFILAFVPPVFAAKSADAPPGLPIPRFVSLKSDKVHLRVGPGKDYPIEWVYVKRGLPVEVIAEYDTWRKIRDTEGAEGWVHQQYLSGRRMAVTIPEIQPLLRKDDEKSPPLAQLESGVVVRLLECDAAWCKIEAAGFRGFVKRTGLWGIYPTEQKIED